MNVFAEILDAVFDSVLRLLTEVAIRGGDHVRPTRDGDEMPEIGRDLLMRTGEAE